MRLVAALFLCFLASGADAPQTTSAPAAIPSHRAGSEPACDASHRGAMIVTVGGADHPDLLKVCLKDGAGRFSWVNASHQNPSTFANVRSFGGCPMFPDNNVWNSTVDNVPVAAESPAIIGAYAAVKLGTIPDFMLNMADAKTPAFNVTFSGSSESDG